MKIEFLNFDNLYTIEDFAEEHDLTLIFERDSNTYFRCYFKDDIEFCKDNGVHYYWVEHDWIMGEGNTAKKAFKKFINELNETQGIRKNRDDSTVEYYTYSISYELRGKYKFLN